MKSSYQCTMKKSLILARGLPGSGKSALTKALNIRAVCNADDYLTRHGVYHWSNEDINLAHNWSRRKCRRFMKKQIETIIVTNVFANDRELIPYIDLARQFGYKLFSIILETRHESTNTHHVPEEAIEKFRKRFDIKL